MPSTWRKRLDRFRETLRDSVLRLLQPDILWGVAGGLLAFAATNIWFYYLGAWPLPGMPSQSLMPDFISFVSTDAFVGAGCGYAGYNLGRAVATMLGYEERAALRVPPLTAFMLATLIPLFVNLVLIGFSFI